MVWVRTRRYSLSGCGSFQITGPQATTLAFNLRDGTVEIFLVDRTNLLQLTSFRRADTSRGTVDVDHHRVFFLASADPFGANPSLNCQIFSIGVLDSDLQQLTDFSQGAHSTLGCGNRAGGAPPGCIIESPRQEPMTQVLVFPSSCDPFDTNANGEQIFAMYPDGTGLQQLTDTRGFVPASPRAPCPDCAHW